MLEFISVILLANSVVLILMLIDLLALRKKVSAVLVMFGVDTTYNYESYIDESNEEVTETDSSVMTEYELQRRQRELEFDERIERMKREMDAEMPERRGTTADILHPNIDNLPHDDIRNKPNQPPYEEVAE